MQRIIWDRRDRKVPETCMMKCLWCGKYELNYALKKGRRLVVSCPDKKGCGYRTVDGRPKEIRRRQKELNIRLPQFIGRKKKIEEFAQILKERATPAERSFLAFMNENGIFPEFQKIVGKKYIADFVFTPKVILELDGRGHFTKGAVKKDARRTEYLQGEAHGYKVVRALNSDAVKMPLNVLLRVFVAIKSRGEYSEQMEKIATLLVSRGIPVTMPIIMGECKHHMQVSCIDCGELCGILTRCVKCRDKLPKMTDIPLVTNKPVCSKCGTILIPRVNSKTKQEFMGCPNYRVCFKQAI